MHSARAVGHGPVGLDVLLLLHLAVVKLLHISQLLLLINSLHRMQGSELIALRHARVSVSLSWGMQVLRFLALRPARRELNGILLARVDQVLKLLGLILILIPVVGIGWGGLGCLDLHGLKGSLKLVKVSLTSRRPRCPQRSAHGELLLGLLRS